MSFNNKLYDMEFEYKSESSTNKTRNGPSSHGYTKTSTVYLIVALAVIVAAILSTGSGIVVYLMTSRDLECKLVIPAGLQKSYTMLNTTLGDMERTTQHVSAAKSTMKTSTMASEITENSSTKYMPASTEAHTRTIITTAKNAFKTTAPAVLPKRTTQNDLAEGTSTGAIRSTVHDAPTSTQKAKEMSCPSGWLTYASSCYYFSSNFQNWTDALMYCSAVKGRLAEIYDAETDAVLTTKVRTLSGDFWIGFTDRKTEGVWVWNGSNTTVTAGMYTNWAPRQPDSEAEDCALIKRAYSFLWNDDQCYKRHKFICEMKMS